MDFASSFKSRLVACVVCVSASAHAVDLSVVPYALKQGLRQGSVLLRAKELGSLLKQRQLDPRTEHFLRLTQEVLAYAEKELGQNVGGNYRRYTDLKRDYLVQVVSAAPADKLQHFLFSYPVVGHLPYQGFFDEDDAVALETKLKQQGLDTYRRKVTAFSSTGWFPDPLLNTMLRSEAYLIDLLFHELTHATFYIESAADFNEAAAEWVALRASQDFLTSLESKGRQDAWIAAARQELEKQQQAERRLSAFVREALVKGREFYARPNPLGQREAFFGWIRARLANEPLLIKWKDKEWNNALLLSLGTYYEWIDPIDAYARREKLDTRAFLQRARERGAQLVQDIQTSK